MYPHRIRLRGPWELEAPEGPRRVVLPGPFPPCRFALRRRFGYPGRIDAHERVWLVADGLAGPASASLNGEALGEFGAGVDITARLLPRNELVIEGEGGWSEVALEVRALAYLRGVRGGLREGRAEATGEAVGEAERPLDLYLLAGRGSVAYTKITPTPQGQPFALAGPAAEGPVRVELVCGAVVWYAARLES